MIPLEPIPMSMRALDGLFVVDWSCPTCTGYGTTAPRSTEAAAWSAAVIIECNHGPGRCKR